ncbi:hypothetical protein [Mesorhizobium sp. M0085]|uniref:hypothetical protein n=1 Tax=Mesorhizobium sp. M0085 TaxID=2956872 RepID=UPI0033351393
MQLPQKMFEFSDVPYLQGKPWIPLRLVMEAVPERLPSGILRAEEFVGIATAAVHSENRADADNFGWSDVGIQPHRAGMETWGYRPADVFRGGRQQPLGLNLVIEQHVEELNRSVWHLHPDLVVALNLVQEGDVWYRPEEGWVEVIRLTRNAEGKPAKFEIRSEFLSDYLAARDMHLFCSSYRQHVVVSATKPTFSWPTEGLNQVVGRDTLEAYTTEAGYPDPVGAFRTLGAIWRTEWIEAGSRSVRIRGDKEQHESSFALKTDGSRVSGGKLGGAISWLYFRPTIVSELLRHRGGHLGWYTRETGAIGATGGTSVHFGLNDLGLITVFAKDIGALPLWSQRLWSAHNVTPEGGVSDELFAAQMHVMPASTKAPEAQLASALEAVDAAFSKRFGIKMLRDHPSASDLALRSQRFKAVEADGLLELSKELSRMFAERIDAKVVTAQLPEPTNENLGSLKVVERLLGTIIAPENARQLMAPLFGIQDLRNASSHLGSSKIASGMERARVESQSPAAMQGRQLLQSFVDTVRHISEILDLMTKTNS